MMKDHVSEFGFTSWELNCQSRHDIDYMYF